MFHHTHPYPPFILENTTRLIVGTLPPPRFTTGDLNEEDVDFCYGSSNGLLWKVWDRIYNLGLVYENTHFAIEQRKAFLKHQKIGVCDIDVFFICYYFIYCFSIVRWNIHISLLVCDLNLITEVSSFQLYQIYQKLVFIQIQLDFQ